MDNLELLYSHYEESFKLNIEAIAMRNKEFLLLCVLEAASFFILVKPYEAFSIFEAGINSSLGTTLKIGNSIIQTLLWVLITYVLIRYVQDTLYVERQYGYLGKMEKAIQAISGISIFDREGDNYLKDYPIVSNLIDIFYKMLMPILFQIINTVHIFREYYTYEFYTLSLVCDIVLFVSSSIITWFYFFEIHNSISSWSKKHIPCVRCIALFLKKILKEV